MAEEFKPIDPAQYPAHWLDVPYATQDPRQVVDIWLPEEGEGPFPLLVFVHGGGWVSGDKRENTMPIVFKAMSQGYALACVEDRLAPDSLWPSALYDVHCAIRFLRAHAQDYRLKTDKIAIMGNSAGAHLANMVAALGGRSILKGEELGYANEDDSVQCLISVYAPTDIARIDQDDWSCISNFDKVNGNYVVEDEGIDDLTKPHNTMLGYPARLNPAAAASAGPVNFITADFPPAYFLHGLSDQIVPYTQSVSMWRKVNDVCGEARAKIELFPGCLHGDPAMKTDAVMNRILDFIDEHIWEGEHQRTELPGDPRVIDEDIAVPHLDISMKD